MRPATTLTIVLLAGRDPHGRHHQSAVAVTGRRRTTPRDRMDNVGAIIEGHDPASVALISRGRSTTYGELQRQVAGLRGGLVEIGIGRGDAVALVCQNGRHFVVAYLAHGRPRRGRRSAEPDEPDRRAAARARPWSAPSRVVAEPSATGSDRGDRPRRAAHAAHDASTSRRSTELIAARAGADRRRRARRPRGADLHQRHGRRAPGGDAQPRQPARQHRRRTADARPDAQHATSCTACCRSFHIFGLNVVIGVTLACRRLRGARAAVRSVDSGRHDRASAA